MRLLGVVDPDLARADSVAHEFDCRSFGSLEQLLTTHSELQAASVTVPTVHHLEVARALMDAGVDVLIEKPIAASLAEADQLLQLARHRGRIAQAGHLERFNPAVRATVPLITQPMFFEVHRLSMFTPRALDVDVVLDLMIHDLDIVLAFVRSPVKEVRAVGLPILSERRTSPMSAWNSIQAALPTLLRAGFPPSVSASCVSFNHASMSRSTTAARMCWSSPWPKGIPGQRIPRRIHRSV